jgi:protein MpaA
MHRNLLSIILASSICLPAFAAPAGAPQADWCKRMVPRLPGVSQAECERSQLALTGAKSRKGFPILMRAVPPKAGKKEPMRVLLLGGIHGDELTSSAIVFEWMQWLQGPQAQEIHWHVVPAMNPDGLLASQPQRVNANGVDLNRNFPTPGWERDAKRYWVKVTGSDPRRFPGKSPLSEPESRWLYDEIEHFRPDVVISVHAPFGVLDFDGPTKAPSRFGQLYFSRVGVYPGSLGNYGGVQKNVPVITIELPHAQEMPSKSETRRIWVDMIDWIVRNVNKQGTVMPVSARPEAHSH